MNVLRDLGNILKVLPNYTCKIFKDHFDVSVKRFDFGSGEMTKIQDHIHALCLLHIPFTNLPQR